MLKVKWVSAFMILGFLVAMQSFAGTSVQSMISKGDHVAQTDYYSQQAKDFKAKAMYWETTAESYEKHSDPNTKTDSDKHAAHCRTIAQNYKTMADEAASLASEHQSLTRKGP